MSSTWIMQRARSGSTSARWPMPDGALTLGELADQVRSKNAGPFWITMDVFFRSEPDYTFVTTSGVLSPQAIGHLYQVDPATVKYFQLPGILAVKISFPRPVTAGRVGARGPHPGQQYLPPAPPPP